MALRPNLGPSLPGRDRTNCDLEMSNGLDVAACPPLRSMDQIEEFSDTRQKSWCIHCGGWISGMQTSGDHVPTKTLLREPYPLNTPVARICTDCNSGFSRDEEYFVAFLGSVLSGSTEPDAQLSS